MVHIYYPCRAGSHDECHAISIVTPGGRCTCWCHTTERVNKPMSKTYRVELHTLTATRAEFREVQEKAERGSGIIWGSTTGHTTFTVSDPSFAPTHTWAMPRTEWEELGRPLSFNLKVEVQ